MAAPASMARSSDSPSSGQGGSRLVGLEFVVMFQPMYGNREPEPVAAFRHEGRAAAYLESLDARSRPHFWLEKDGQVVENVRYREADPGCYGHAWAFAKRVPDEERERLRKQGFRFADTGLTR